MKGSQSTEKSMRRDFQQFMKNADRKKSCIFTEEDQVFGQGGFSVKVQMHLQAVRKSLEAKRRDFFNLYSE